MGPVFYSNVVGKDTKSPLQKPLSICFRLVLSKASAPCIAHSPVPPQLLLKEENCAAGPVPASPAALRCSEQHRPRGSGGCPQLASSLGWVRRENKLPWLAGIRSWGKSDVKDEQGMEIREHRLLLPCLLDYLYWFGGEYYLGRGGFR